MYTGWGCFFFYGITQWMAPRALASLLRTLRANGVTHYSDGALSVQLDPAFKAPARATREAPETKLAPRDARAAQNQLLSDLFAHEGQ